LGSDRNGFSSPAFWAATVEAVGLAVPSLVLTVVSGALMAAISSGRDDPDGRMSIAIVLAVPLFAIGSLWTTACSARIRWRSGSYVTSIAIIAGWVLAHILPPAAIFVATGSFKSGNRFGVFVSYVLSLSLYFLGQAVVGYIIGSVVASFHPAPEYGPDWLSDLDVSEWKPPWTARALALGTLAGIAVLTMTALLWGTGLRWASLPLAALLLGRWWTRSRQGRRQFRRITKSSGATAWDRVAENVELLDSVGDEGEAERMMAYLSSHGAGTSGAKDAPPGRSAGGSR